MKSEKFLKQVCHNIAQYAGSALSSLSPHLYEASRIDNSSYVVLDLLNDNPCPAKYSNNKYLNRASKSLKNKFDEMLENEGYNIEILSQMTLKFDFPFMDKYSVNCEAKLISKKGLSILFYIDYLGNTISKNITKLTITRSGVTSPNNG